MAKYQRKQGDTATITEQLLDPTTDEPLDLTGADSVEMYMEHIESETVVIHDPVSITDPGTGRVSIDVPKSATTRDGRYQIEFLAVFPDGRRISYPASGFITLTVDESTGRELPDPVIQIVTESTPDPVAVTHVQSESDLTSEGWYYIEDTAELVYFDGDSTTN